MQMFRFDLDWSTLDATPEEERTLALMLGKLHNELNILGNLVASFSVKDDEIALEREGRAAQSFMFMTILAGRLHEGWNLLQKQYFRNSICKKYDLLIGNKSYLALGELKAYFSSGNRALNIVRNRYAFHFDPQIIKENYSSVSKVDPCNMYMGMPSNCNFFQVSESLFSRSILNEIGGGDPLNGMNILVSDSSVAIGNFHSFIGGYVMAFINEYWKDIPKDHLIDVGNRPLVGSVNIPFLMTY